MQAKEEKPKKKKSTETLLPEFETVPTAGDQEQLVSEDDSEDCAFTDLDLGALDLRGKSISRCTFRDCKLLSCKFRLTNMSNVLFENCELSNSVFYGLNLYRVRFANCKLLGVRFENCGLRHVSFFGNMQRLSSFDHNRWANVRIEQCNLQETGFFESTLTETTLLKTDMKRMEVYRTPLKGIDFSDCEIAGASVDQPCLRGAIISAPQALDMVKALGVVVK